MEGGKKKTVLLRKKPSVTASTGVTAVQVDFHKSIHVCVSENNAGIQEVKFCFLSEKQPPSHSW